MQNKCKNCDGCGEVVAQNPTIPWSVYKEQEKNRGTRIMLDEYEPATCPACDGTGKDITPDKSYLNGGLDKTRYVVGKENGIVSPRSRYFVLRYDSDPHARVALRAYADSVRKENQQLADDLMKAIGDAIFQEE